MRKLRQAIVLAIGTVMLAQPAWAAAKDNAELAKDLSNPVASMISAPFQFNYDCCAGTLDAQRITLNIQPVIPFALDDRWNLIVRTIMPLIDQGELFPGDGNHSGAGDITQSFFFSPNNRGGVFWGIGPAFLWPAATDSFLGARAWGVGPTGVALIQSGPWTVGGLANHIWSYAGESKRPNVSATFLQPFVAYTWPDSTGLTLNSETTYDWIAEEWTVPLNLTLSHLFRFGNQPVSLQLGSRWYATRPNDGSTWGLRFNVVFLFPE